MGAGSLRETESDTLPLVKILLYLQFGECLIVDALSHPRFGGISIYTTISQSFFFIAYSRIGHFKILDK